MRTIEWRNGKILTLDQTELPHKEIWIELETPRDVAAAIMSMKMRGAPLIGVAAAYGMALAAFHSGSQNIRSLREELKSASRLLKETRPTAINLFWAIDRIMAVANENYKNPQSLKESVLHEAHQIADEDVETNRSIGKNGSGLIDDSDAILTHCNAGSLATVDYGTALAVIRASWESGKKISVFADETRPLLQGARLTMYELMQDGIPATLITDSMAGYLMSEGVIDKIVVGADRIVSDAVINKIGTYSVAVMAHENDVPFYVAAPFSTFDLKKKAKDIVIERRDPREVTDIGSVRIAPSCARAMNPAFDITPIKYVDAVICEKGVLSRWDFRELVRGMDYQCEEFGRNEYNKR